MKRTPGQTAQVPKTPGEVFDMQHVGTVPLETERLRLRRFTLEDAEEMYQNWANDPQVTRWMRWEPHADVAETRGVLEDWVASYPRDEFYLWAVQRKSDGVLIGSIGAFPAREPGQQEQWETGYCLGRAFWGQGYTTEALQALVALMETRVGLDRLHACHAVGNPASGRVLTKAGFVYTGDGVYHKLDGAPVPALYYVKKRKED